MSSFLYSDVAGARRYHVYNLAGDLVHVDDIQGGKRTDYVKMGKQTIARVTNGVATYLHHDLLGSPAAGTNPQGQVLWRERYTPYGETLQNPAANANQASFTGHVRDAETGLVYMQQRYYDPVIGRFYSNDPVGFSADNPMMFNRYAYGNNNPYKFVDPDGRAAESFFVSGKVYETKIQAVTNAVGDLKQSMDSGIQSEIQAVDQVVGENADLVADFTGVLPHPAMTVISVIATIKSDLHNNSVAATSGAIAGGLTKTMMTDIATNAGSKIISGKTEFAIVALSSATGAGVTVVQEQNEAKMKETEIKDK